jgi:hypothetical protein
MFKDEDIAVLNRDVCGSGGITPPFLTSALDDSLQNINTHAIDTIH